MLNQVNLPCLTTFIAKHMSKNDVSKALFKVKTTDKLRVAVMGEFSAGKSTFINALLGGSYAKVDILPTTSIPTVYEYGIKDEIEVYFKDGTSTFMPMDKFGEITTKIDGKATDFHQKVLYAKRYCSVDILKKITFVDTPGFNDSEDWNQKSSVLNQVLQADIIVWLTHNNGGKLSELETIKEIYYYAGIKPIGIINKIDLVDEEEDEIEDVIYSYKKRFAGYTNTDYVFPTSAETVCAGGTDEGFDDFKTFILKEAFAKKESLKSSALYCKEFLEQFILLLLEKNLSLGQINRGKNLLDYKTFKDEVKVDTTTYVGTLGQINRGKNLLDYKTFKDEVKVYNSTYVGTLVNLAQTLTKVLSNPEELIFNGSGNLINKMEIEFLSEDLINLLLHITILRINSALDKDKYHKIKNTLMEFLRIDKMEGSGGEFIKGMQIALCKAMGELCLSQENIDSIIYKEVVAWLKYQYELSGNIDCLEKLGDFYVNKNSQEYSLKRATTYYNNYLQYIEDPQVIGAIYNKIGEAYHREGLCDSAISYYSDSIKAYGDKRAVKIKLALAYYDRGSNADDYLTAGDLYDEILNQYPNLPSKDKYKVIQGKIKSYKVLGERFYATYREKVLNLYLEYILDTKIGKDIYIEAVTYIRTNQLSCYEYLSTSDNYGEVLYGIGLYFYDNEQYAEAYPYFYGAFAEGDYRCLFCLGYMFADGLGVEKDVSKAIESYEESIRRELSIGAAANNLGVIYKHEYENYDKAVQYFKISADNDDDYGYLNLAVSYQDASGCSLDYNKAYNAMSRAYKLGNVKSIYYLAQYNFYGIGCSINYGDSYKYYKELCDKDGDAATELKTEIMNEISEYMQNPTEYLTRCVQLAHAYYNGYFVNESKDTASNLYYKAAIAGDLEAGKFVTEAYYNYGAYQLPVTYNQVKKIHRVLKSKENNDLEAKYDKAKWNFLKLIEEYMGGTLLASIFIAMVLGISMYVVGGSIEHWFWNLSLNHKIILHLSKNDYFSPGISLILYSLGSILIACLAWHYKIFLIVDNLLKTLLTLMAITILIMLCSSHPKLLLLDIITIFIYVMPIWYLSWKAIYYDYATKTNITLIQKKEA